MQVFHQPQMDIYLSQDWYSIRRVVQINQCSRKRFDWRKLRDASGQMGYGILKIFNPNFGEVNTYHAKVWEKVYPNMEL